jgi:hypothetical protein
MLDGGLSQHLHLPSSASRLLAVGAGPLPSPRPRPPPRPREEPPLPRDPLSPIPPLTVLCGPGRECTAGCLGAFGGACPLAAGGLIPNKQSRS